MSQEPDSIAEGQRAYQDWRRDFLADPENRRICEEEVRKKDCGCGCGISPGSGPPPTRGGRAHGRFSGTGGPH